MRASDNFHNKVFDNCGDAGVITSQKKKIDLTLKYYKGILLMINTNSYLVKERANGTLCRGIGIKLKTGSKWRMKKWD